MTIAPLPARRSTGPRLLSARVPANRRPPTPRGIARRRWTVNVTKWLLPLLALALLSTIALWPEIQRMQEEARESARRFAGDIDGARVTDPRYRGLDEHGQPYTVTAAQAVQVDADRYNLTRPQADLTSASGTWTQGQSLFGVYAQKSDQLDLSGDVVLYRDNGTTLHTQAATIDLRQGAAAGSVPVHAEGPFGTLDAQGFALTDKGQVIQFTGPARLVLNGAGG